MKTQTMDHIGALASKATVGAGAAGATFSVAWGWLQAEHIISLLGVMAGLLVGLLGAGITWYYKRKANRRHEQEAALRQELLRARIAHLRGGVSDQIKRTDTDWGVVGVADDGEDE